MNEKPDLVGILVETYINTGEMPIPKVFRAAHADHLDEIDRLQTAEVLQSGDNGRYKIPVRFFRQSVHWPREKRIANKIGLKLKELYRADPTRPEFTRDLWMPQEEPGLDDRGITRALYYLTDLGLLSYSSTVNPEGKITAVAPRESILKFTDIDARIDEDEKSAKEIRTTLRKTDVLSTFLGSHQHSSPAKSPSDVPALWVEIKSTYSVSKPQFGKRIAFVKAQDARDLIFRDVAHAHGCLKLGFYKSAVVLAGGVIEHLLHCYLQHKGHPISDDNFSQILKVYDEHDLIKAPILHLSSAIKEFRNLVHLKREIADPRLISKTTATGAVNSIFTISSAFDN